MREKKQEAKLSLGSSTVYCLSVDYLVISDCC